MKRGLLVVAVLLSFAINPVKAKATDCAEAIDNYNWCVGRWEIHAALLSDAWDQLVADYNNGATPEQVNADTQTYNFYYGVTTGWANAAADAYEVAHNMQCM